MPPRDKNIMSKESKKALKDEIENLLNSVDHDEFNDSIVDNQLKEDTKPESPYDFTVMQEEFTKKSKDITDSMLKHYVDLGIIENNEYLKHKKELDTIHLSNIFFQMKTLKITIAQVMEEITSGNRHPRLIEVMGQLQEKLKSITQMQANYMLFLEDTYKKVNSERPLNSIGTKIEGGIKREGEFFVTVGTKNVINNLPETPRTIKGDGSDLINPNNKTELMRANNIEFEEEDDNDEFIDVTEII